MISEESKIWSQKILDMILFVALIIFSFYFTFETGRRGFFPMDQSIVFDGGYRILSGQVPYKDFLIPFGPVAFLLQGIFFKFLGTNYFSYLFCAASINILTTVCSLIILRLLFPSRKFLSYVAALLTAVWFYPPFGTPWPEQTSFFFSFLGIAALLSVTLDKNRSSISNAIFLLISGCLATLAFLSKQNAGLFILPLYPLLLVAAHLPDLRKSFCSFAMFFTGFVGGLIAFLFWVWFNCDLKVFIQYFIEIPASLGIDRLFEDWSGLFLNLLIGKGPISNRLVILASLCIAIVMVVLYFHNFKRLREAWRRQFLSCIVCSYCAFFQYFFILNTLNQPENAFPFVGIIISIGIGILLHLLNVTSSITRRINCAPLLTNQNVIKILLGIVLSISISYVLMRGVRVSLNREVHDIFNRSRFQEHVAAEGLECLKWGEPTIMRGAIIEQDDIVNIIRYLKGKKKSFFIFPDFTIFYGLLNVPSPQPVLWFHKGLTYPRNYDSNLDRWIVEDLRKNMVEIVILEEKSWIDTENRLDDFPRLKSYIENSFSRAKRIGIFNIYEKTQTLADSFNKD